MHVDNWDPNTYLWILQEADVPYVPDEWNKILLKYGADKTQVSGKTIVGRYIGKMKLKQFKMYRWKDTEFLQEMHDKKVKETMEKQGYDAATITQVLEKGTIDIPKGELAPPEPPATYDAPRPESANDSSWSPVLDESDMDLDLTDDDKIYLKLKWGKLYKPSEWVQLEQLYNDMMNSYDIQEAGHIDTLKLICKTSLKANQLIDIGDMDGYAKTVRVYNDLMKSGNFDLEYERLYA